MMYKTFRAVALVISVFAVSSTFATPSFCKCRKNGKPDNDITSDCCYAVAKGWNFDPDLEYSWEHHRCDCADEQLYDDQITWAACCTKYGDAYNCELG